MVAFNPFRLSPARAPLLPLTDNPSQPASSLLVILRLSRAKMTVISAVTYLAGALFSATPFSTQLFLRGWLFVLLCQFATHFVGEVFDAHSDKLNKYATPLTGGSKVLPNGHLSHATALRYAIACAILAATSIPLILPQHVQTLAFTMWAMAIAYSAPPFKLNHRALGEIDAAIITNILLPYFAAATQRGFDSHFPWYDPALNFLVLPPFCVKIALFLVLNLADRRPDWATGKITLPVLLGNRRSALLHAFLMSVAYLLATALALRKLFGHAVPQWKEASVLLFILPSAPYGFAISRQLLRQVPYRLDHLLAPTLFHSTLLVWGVLVHTMLFAIPRDGVFNFQTAFAALFAHITIRNVLKGRQRAAKKNDSESSDREQMSLNTPSQNTSNTSPQFSQSNSSMPETGSGSTHSSPLTGAEAGTRTMSSQPARRDVVIVGAGVGGLVAAVALSKMGRSVVVLEKRSGPDEAETGADLALWPGAIAILKALGVSPDFFETDCFPLEKVHICNMDFEHASEEKGIANAATILKTIDMAKVTEGTGEHFVLLPRQRLMESLRRIVPDGVVVYGVDSLNISENEENDSVTTKFTCDDATGSPFHFSGPESTCLVTSRIIIGADGSRSKLRHHVSPDLGGPDAVRFCGEVCYRGVLNLGPHGNFSQEASTESHNEIRDRVAALFPDAAADRTMRINYGAGLRSSFGHMSADGNIAYWWVKVQMAELPENRGKLKDCNWPEPLKSLHDVTSTEAFYMHPIEDSGPLPKWSSPRVVLVGDAAHVVTPNMGQGACLATEDAFVLATELVTHWKWPDGHLEAFYNYEQIRRPYADAVAAEARKQLFLGQLRSRPAVFLREALLQLVPASVLQKSLKRNNFAVQKYIEVLREEAIDSS